MLQWESSKIHQLVNSSQVVSLTYSLMLSGCAQDQFNMALNSTLMHLKSEMLELNGKLFHAFM
jgi:hypothetical protein